MENKYLPLFTSAEDWQNNACLNYLHDSLEVYALGYKKGADVLVSNIMESARDQDSLVYPIVFLYRQYLELRLKEIIREGNCLLKNGKSFPPHHRIHDLWPAVKGIIRNVFEKKNIAEFEFVEHVISEFSNVDPESFSFRYPTDKDGNNSTKNITHINLRHLSENIEKVSTYLDSVSFNISVYRDYENELNSNLI